MEVKGTGEAERRKGRKGIETRQKEDQHEQKRLRDLGRARGSPGLPNWLRKCNGNFYNVRIYTPSPELRMYLRLHLHTTALSKYTLACHPLAMHAAPVRDH